MWRPSAIGLLLLLLIGSTGALADPPAARACTGMTVPLEEILRTARAIVVVEVLEVREPTWQGEMEVTPWRHAFRVEEVLAGATDPGFVIEGPIRTTVCDALVGTSGDRMVMAIDARGFDQAMYPYWPLEVADAGDHPGGREDLDELLARVALVGPSPAPPHDVDWRLPVGAGAFVIGVLALFALDRGRRSRA
jgi:hypothetical protein